MGRKTVIYCPETFPLLAEKYARDGLIDTEIAKKLGIGKSLYYKWQNMYPELEESIKRGKRPVDVQVENALIKRALGYSYEEKTTEMLVDANGSPTIKNIKVTKKEVAPDVGAIAFWLKNRMPLDWRDRKEIDANMNTNLSLADLLKP